MDHGKEDCKSAPAADHLPLYGPGPFFASAVVAMTLAGWLLRGAAPLASGCVAGWPRAVMIVLGAVLAVAAAALWVYAVLITKIDDGIREDRLVTTGAYAWVRNPIYSAIMIAGTGALLMAGNLWLLLLPLLWWLFLTVLMKATEEKWLRDCYGREYDDYCRRVNRCWPRFPRG